MSTRVSAGLLAYRIREGRLEVFIAHPGGPLFAHRDDGYWSIPKGEIEPDEELLATAIREFSEEVGINVPADAAFIPLGSVRQKGGKLVHAWAVVLDLSGDPDVRSNLFTLEWPPGSGRVQQFPEVDRAGFFPATEAKRKLKPAQAELVDRLIEKLGTQGT